LSDLKHPRLLSFSLDDWTVLGRKITLDLTKGAGILVGRNGAGKSAILEGLDAISSLATGRLRARVLSGDHESVPKVLEALIVTPDDRLLTYRYELIPTPISNDEVDSDENTSDDVQPDENIASWNDCCQYSDGQQETIWSTEAGVTTLHSAGNELNTLVLGSTSSLGRIRHGSSGLPIKFPIEMVWTSEILRGIRILGKDPVRRTRKRRKSRLEFSRGFPYPRSSFIFELADGLSRKILRRMETGDIEEFESVCQRIGVGKRITAEKFFPSRGDGENHEKEEEEYISSVLLDGTNIGLLSDGTLRVLSILIEVMSSSPASTTIIEEPEMQIHPGLLSKLLAEIKAYTFGENLVISTHSPQVVSQVDPQSIHLVCRIDGQTHVRKLREDEIDGIAEYLCEEGNLGDWIYGGMLDE